MIELLLLMAPSGGEQGGGGGFSFFIFLGLFFLIIYFFMIRPQQKKAKQQKNFLADLKKGDRIVTIGGIYGKIVDQNEETFLLEIDNNVKIRIDKSVISLDMTRAMLDRTGKKENDKDKK